MLRFHCLLASVPWVLGENERYIASIEQRRKAIYQLTIWFADLQISASELDTALAGLIGLCHFVKKGSQPSRNIGQVGPGVIRTWVKGQND